jgi:pyrroline-5-carboxylate reductase
MKKIGFVGAGNMAGALIRGLLRAGQYESSDIVAADPIDVQLRRLKRAHKIDVVRDNRELVKQSQTVILAVKPQTMAAVLDEIRAEVNPRSSSSRSQRDFPCGRLEAGPRRPGACRARDAQHARCWSVVAVSVAVAGSKATPADLKQTLKLFKAVGEAVSITGEDLLDAVTALSGSGPPSSICSPRA